jgi:chemotaxis signal transduction protein
VSSSAFRDVDPARVLEERARALARPLETEEVATLGTLVVAVGNERYALDLEHVLAIERARELTPVPGVPESWAGMANVHGTLFPILDLGRYLGIARPRPAARRHLVLVHGGGIDVGLLVDDVSDVTLIRRDAIGAPPNVSGRRVVYGVTSDLISLLDLEAVLADPDLVVDEEER